MNSLPILIALAFAPAIYLAIVLYGKDKYEPEPKKILLKAFMLGAISILPAAFIELFLQARFDFKEWGIWNSVLHAFVIVALTEELCKFTMLRLHAYRLPEFNEPFDGIVYAAFVSLGFAAAENIFYVLQGGFSVGVMRMFTSVPAHFSFGVIMGYYVGKAKFEPARRPAYMLQGLLFASFMHGAYDFFIFQQNYPALGVLTLLVLIISIRFAQRAIAELQKDSVFRFHARQNNELPNKTGFY